MELGLIVWTKIMDFTLERYDQLLKVLISKRYHFQTFENFIQKPRDKVIVLRHDVDKRPENARRTAIIENINGVCASYYYRMTKTSYNPKLIRDVIKLGHEIGYHYEDLTLCKGAKTEAIRSFEKNLEYLRLLYPVSTICMHGSPLSKWDNSFLWESYSYRDYGIIADPVNDVDFNDVLYLTDTGRSWNNSDVSVRDKVYSKYKFVIKSTVHLIELIESNSLPDKIIINTHPQRWFAPGFLWVKELLVQNLKNQVKKYFIIKKK